MNIPEGVNFIEFYKAAKAKGVKISSRFPGVCVGNANGGLDVVWRAQFNKDGIRHQQCFPFTKEGELLAAQKYLRMKSGNL